MAVTDDGLLEDIGTSLAWLAAIGAFVVGWGYCTVRYGFLFGFGLGWLPAGLLAVIFAALARWLWPLAVIGGPLSVAAAISALVGWA
jgi:integral membrane sensor domain MASE1